jgi:hypothetical protein
VTDTETDPFSQLLAEALRAGPGSAAWQEAVAQIGANSSSSDEHHLLLEARELLASGKTFREIRAGVGFTRKLMEGLDREKEEKKKGIPTPTIIAMIALAAILGAVAWIGLHLFSSDSRNSSGSDLAAMYFPTELANATFAGSVPAGWRTIGKLPLDFANGLKPAAGSSTTGAAVTLASSISADEPFAFEVDLRLTNPKASAVAQIFISTSGDFSDDRATSSHELLWSLRGKSQQVVLDGRVLPESESAVDGNTVRVRIVMNRDQAIVESNGHRLWSGSHKLDPNPRWPGVRFIRSSGNGDAGITVQSVKVLKR